MRGRVVCKGGLNQPMADLYQYRTAPEEPLDCLYVLYTSGSDPIANIALETKEKRALRTKIKGLAPRGEEGEIISGECPLDFARRVTFVGLGDENELTHGKLRDALRRVMRQATRNHEYQIGLAVSARVHGLSHAESTSDHDLRGLGCPRRLLSSWRGQVGRRIGHSGVFVGARHRVTITEVEERNGSCGGGRYRWNRRSRRRSAGQRRPSHLR